MTTTPDTTDTGPGDVVLPPIDQKASTKISDQSEPQNEPKHGSIPETSGVAPKSRSNTGEFDPSQELSTLQDGHQGPPGVSLGGAGGTPPAPGLERRRLQTPPVSEWAGPHKPGPRSELHSSDIQEGYVDVDEDEFGNEIDTPDVPRHLPRNPKDTGSALGHGDHPDPNHAAAHAVYNRNLGGTRSDIGHGEGDRSRDASHAAGVAAHHRSLKGAGHTTGQIHARGPRSGEGPNRQEPPGAFHEQGIEDNRQQGIGGYTLGGIASSIQAAVMPTPQQKIQQLKDELRGTQSQLSDTRGHLDAYARELKRTRGENRQMAHHINGLDHERQRLKEANQSYENELSIIRRELEDAKNLALIRGKELVGAQVFLTKADALSISEVVDKVNNLNEEIFQAAALLGEVLIYKPHDIPQEGMNYALGIAQGMVGSKIIKILHEQTLKEVPEANPLIVQVVLQVFLVTYCSQMVQSWSSDAGAASYLTAVYSRIRDKEEQAVSGRWRALTRSHTRPTPEGWREDLLRKLGSVLRIAAWMTPSAQHRDAFEQKLEPIFRAVEDLRNALGEKFTSADLEVSVMEADQLFQPSYMDDAYGDPDRKPAGKHAPQEVVIGTTGIGLKKAALKRSTKGEVLYENVLSAKVALESTILEALNPPPPRSGRKKKVLVKLSEKDDLPPPPKQATGTGMSKPPSSASAAASTHSPQHASGAPPGSSQRPTAHSKPGQTLVKHAPQPHHQGGAPPESQEGIASTGPGSQQPGQQPKSVQRQTPCGSPPQLKEADVSAGTGPQQTGQHREVPRTSRDKPKDSKPKDNRPKDDGGIEGALVHILEH